MKYLIFLLILGGCGHQDPTKIQEVLTCQRQSNSLQDMDCYDHIHQAITTVDVMTNYDELLNETVLKP